MKLEPFNSHVIVARRGVTESCCITGKFELLKKNS